MVSWRWLVRGIVCAGAVWLMSWLVGSLMAESKPVATQQPQPTAQRVYPQAIERPYSPAVRGCFGYYSTVWRRWPGERLPEQTNPRSVGLEPLPTPQGREEIQPPKAAMPKETAPQAEPPQQPQQPAAPQQEILPPDAGKIVPPEGLLIPSKPAEESLGEPKKPAATPAPEHDLPSLPELPPDSEPSGLPDTKTPPPKEKEPQEPKPTTGARYQQSSGVAHDLWQSGVVSLASATESQQQGARAGVHRADAIDVATTPTKATVVAKEPAAYAVAESHPRAATAAIVTPSVALDGYCPVELTDGGRWTRGDLRWTVVHKGWIYRLSGVQQRQQFLANPDKYVPVNSGNDSVISADESRQVPGVVTYCALYNGHLYMFSSAATQARFNANPQRYAAR